MRRPRRGRRRLAQETAPRDSATPENDKQPTLPPSRLAPSKTDMFVILTLWSSELVRLLLVALTDSFVAKTFPESLEEISRSMVSSVAVIVLTMAVIAAMINRHSDKKFWVYFTGLAVYFLTPIFALGLLFRGDVGTVIAMIWLEFAWYVVHPLRFLMIFHQVFPIGINYSNFIVVICESANTVIDYFTELWITNAYIFSHRVFTISWSVMVAICAFWLMLTLLAKRYVNPVPDEIDAIREIYEPTEVIHNFNRKQQPINTVLLLSILYPGAIFAIMETTYIIGMHNLVHKTIKYHDTSFMSYRVDLIVTLVVIFIMTIISLRIRKYRNEIVDLVFITAGYILNIIVLILLLGTVTGTAHLPSANVNYCNLAIYAFPKYYSNKAVYTFQLGKQYLSKNSYGSANLEKYLNAQVPVVGAQTIEARMILLPTGEVVFDTKVEVKARRRIMYQYVNSSRLIQIQDVDNFVPGQYKPQMLIINQFKDCNDYDEEIYNETGPWDEKFTKFFFVPICQVCAPFEMETSSENGTHMYKIPSVEESLGPLTLPCQSVQCRFFVTFNNNKYFMKKKGVVVFEETRVALTPHQMYILRLEQDPDTCYTIRGQRFNVVSSEKEPIIAEGTFGAVMAMVHVSYIHLMWAEVSVKYRTFIVYSFFALEIIAQWTTRMFIYEFTPTVVVVLLVLSSVGLIWHTAVSTVYTSRILKFQKLGAKLHGFKRI